jgi:hypothetical protein
MKKFVLSSIFIGLLLNVNSAMADYQWGFGNLSVNYLDWDKGTENKSTKTDFTYLEIEGGSQHTWGDLYGFFDIENIGKTGSEVRTASKASINYYLGGTKFGLYAHQYSFHSLGFSEQNRVIGFGYVFAGEGWWIKPFVGFHDVLQTFYSGANGYMAGWVLGYDFTLFGQKLTLIDWHEMEFERHEQIAAGNGNRSGINGAASVWWTFAKDLTLGQQWRYGTNKLGTAGEMNAWISTLKWNY